MSRTLREAIEAMADTYAEAPSLLSPSDEWKRGWLRCIEQAEADLRQALAESVDR